MFAFSTLAATNSNASGLAELKSAGMTGPPAKPPSTISVKRVEGEKSEITNERFTPLIKKSWS